MCSNVDEHRLKTRWLIDRGILTLGKAEQEAVKLMQKSIRDASIISDTKRSQPSVRHVKTYGDNDIIGLSIILSLAAKHKNYFCLQFNLTLCLITINAHMHIKYVTAFRCIIIISDAL